MDKGEPSELLLLGLHLFEFVLNFMANSNEYSS